MADYKVCCHTTSMVRGNLAGYKVNIKSIQEKQTRLAQSLRLSHSVVSQPKQPPKGVAFNTKKLS